MLHRWPHRDIGRDRSSLVATLYRMYFGGLAAQDALQEMKDYGFKDSWTLLGLKKYLLKHPQPPASLASISHTCLAAPSQSVCENYPATLTSAEPPST
jgi:hypothetical protein